MGSKAGTLKTAAKRVGLTLAEYQEHEAAGLRWCCGCKAWHPAANFTTDLSRGDGLARTCRTWRNANVKGKPESVEKRRARRLVQSRVRRGAMPHPGTLPCSGCKKTAAATGKRHEYHHHNGYGPGHQADVIPMCSTCHRQEEN